MFNESKVFATVAVKDIAVAKEFYGGKLGLHQTDENPGGVTYESGGGKLFVYQSPTAGSGQATCASWEVSDIVAIVGQLKSNGVTFETYEIPGAKQEGEVTIMGGMKAAWFKDPDGNILSVGSRV